MKPHYDLIIDSPGPGGFVLAWHAARSGRRVLVTKGNNNGKDGHLLPGFGALNTAALTAAFDGLLPDPVRQQVESIAPQSIVQVISPDFRFHWWTDRRRGKGEWQRVFGSGVHLDTAVRAFTASLFRPGRFAPQGWFRSRLGRTVKVEAPASLTGALDEYPHLRRLLELTGAALSGGYEPSNTASLLHGETGEAWVAGPAATAVRKGLQDAVRQAGAAMADGSIHGILPRERGFTVEWAGSGKTTGADTLVLGEKEPVGFPLARSLSKRFLGLTAIEIVTSREALDPAVGPRAIWCRNGLPDAESGPRIVWIGREPLGTDRQRIILSFRRVAEESQAASDSRLGQIALQMLEELSPGFRKAQAAVRILDPYQPWLPVENSRIEKPRLDRNLFRLNAAVVGPYGSIAELAQARDLGRWFSVPDTKAA